MSAFDQLAAKLAALKSLPHNDPGFGQPFIGPHPGQPGYVAPIPAHGIPHYNIPHYNPGAPGDSGFGGFGQGGHPLPHPHPLGGIPHLVGGGQPMPHPLGARPMPRPNSIRPIGRM